MISANKALFHPHLYGRTVILMKDYARKIYAFAYAKTGNTRDAEDLSQDILLELYRSDISAARDPDAWVSGICRHVWARFLDRNKRHWEALGASPAMEFIAADDTAALSAEKQAEYEELRREIAYLSRTRREVLIMYYFDGQSVENIARKLDIAAVTVRWHMSKARTELKERLNMENRNGMREKVRLNVGHSGQVMDWRMNGLNNDLLTQNVAWVCYGKKLTVEDVARELGVPAVYLESILERLVEMDYMTVSGGRYSTNFFIWDKESAVTRLKYSHRVYQEFADVAVRAWERVKKDIAEIGFVGCGLPENELMWHFIPMIIEHGCWKAMKRLMAEKDLKFDAPVRADGSRHFVYAAVNFDSTGDAFYDGLRRDAQIHGIKSRSSEKVESEQYDFGMLTEWREFNGEDLVKLSHVVHADGEMSDELKEEAAGLIRDGYVEAHDGELRVMIPYFDKAQWERFEQVVYRALTEEDVDVIYRGYAGFMNMMDGIIPAHISKNDRNWLLMGCDDFGMLMWHLVNSGKLAVPEKNVARRLATVVHEIK